MSTVTIKSLVLLWCITCALGNNICPTYKDHMKSMLETGFLDGLRDFFVPIMNNKERGAIVTYRLLPIDNTIWPEDSAMKILVSLSKPLLSDIGKANRWPENNNIRLDDNGPANTLNPSTSYHAGIRYIYNCKTLQTISCFKGTFNFHQDRPILNHYREEIFVPVENMAAANGDAMADHLSEQDGFYRVTGCNKMAVKECGSRQVFYNATNSADDCVFNLQFFSLPENVMVKSANENILDPTWITPLSLTIEKQYFIVMY